MKPVILLFAVVFSSSVLAARLPTVDETMAMESTLKNSESISKVIDLINRDKFNPFFRDAGDEGFIATPGQSKFATVVLRDRMLLDNPLGSENENLGLLILLIKKGLNLNIPHEEFSSLEKMTLLDRASSECQASVVELFIRNGADPALEDFYWLNALRKSFNYDIGSDEDVKCTGVVLKFLDASKGLSIETIYRFLSGNFKMTGNPFLKGSLLDLSLGDEVKAKLHEKLELKNSSRPSSAEPSDEWFIKFKRDYEAASAENEPRWWTNFSQEERAWACYYSSFDEAYPLFKKAGLSDEELMYKPLPSAYGTNFGKFSVKTFVPFCNSIR